MPRKKRIAIDFYEIKNRDTGLGEYSWSLAQEIASRAEEIDAEVYFIVPNSFTGVFGDKVRYINRDAFARFTRLALRIFPRRYEIYHRVHQFSKTRSLLFSSRNIITIHDINFVHDPAELKVRKYTRRTQRFIDKADAVVAISNFVDRDLREHFEVRTPVEVIHNGVTDLGPLAGDITPGEYLLHLSSLMPKKNTALLIEMMQYLPGEKLVVAGNLECYGQSLIKLVKDLGLTNVTFAGKVSIDSKARLMAGCKAFLFPSLCEGFGLPPLEAMLFGKKVFLSDLTSLPEVGGDYAYYWNELDPRKMAVFVEKNLDEDRFSPEEINKWAGQFTWTKTASKHICLYNNMLSNKSKV